MSQAPSMICSRCRKSFEKASTFKRHGYYCRSKTDGDTISRKRSCAACTKSKTRCDSRLPKCSNCISKKIDCLYAEGALRNIGRKSLGSPKASTTSSGNADGTIGSPATTSTSMSVIALDPYLYGGIEDETFGSNLCIFKWPEPFSVTPDATPRIEELYHPGAGRQLSPLSLDLPLSIPDLLTPQNPRSLVRRSMGKPLAQTSADILLRMFGSFTSMMARKETFPPFINSKCFSNIPGKENEIPEALVNCMSLSRMFAERTAGTSKLLWRTIRMEHERLWFQHDSFNNWELLAAVQALMIYALMRIIDGETEHNDFDVPLMISVNSICQRLADRIGGGDYHNIISDQKAWHDWVFYESRRRFIIIARILNLLVDMGHSLTCSSLPGFILVPLPSKKVLWEAPNEEVWQKEFETTLRAREIFGVTTEGRLVRLVQEMNRITATNAEWEEWYAGSDGFGSLVMLAASLLG